jgi:uncharacterized membrane protein
MRPIAKAGSALFALALAMTAGAAQAGSAAAGPTSGAPCGAMQPLALPNGAYSASVRGADPTGRFQVGAMMDTTFNSHLLRWVDGVPQDLSTTHVGGKAVNSLGDIAGSTFDDETSRDTPWRYHDGQFTDLPTEPPGHSATPTGINAAGTISGFVRDASDTVQPVIWSLDNVMRRLPLPPGDEAGLAEDIDDDGTIVGKTGSQADGAFRPVRWRPDGTVERFPGIQPNPNTGFEDLAIRGGWVTGTEFHDPNSTPSQVLRWSGGTSQPETLGQGTAEAVNSHGSVVMLSLPDAKLQLVQNGVVRSLPSDDEPFPTARVTALTDDHIAYGYWHSTPMRWDCRPAS